MFRCNPSLRAAVITPPELATVINLFPWSSSAASPHGREERPPDLPSRGLLDVRYLRPVASLPGLSPGLSEG